MLQRGPEFTCASLTSNFGSYVDFGELNRNGFVLS